MILSPQIVQQRDLIETELVPRVVTRLSASPFPETPNWVCEFCGHISRAPTPLLARHDTYCKLGTVIGVKE